MQDLFDSARVCVSSPYYALDDLRVLAPGYAEALVPCRHRTGQQELPISAADAGRRLAVLGLCAAETARVSGASGASGTSGEEEAPYYLVRSLYAEYAPPSAWPEYAMTLVAEAGAGFHGYRHAFADARLTGEFSDDTYVSARVEYDVLPAVLFERMVPTQPVPAPAPVAGSRTPGPPSPALAGVSYDNCRVSAGMLVTPELCAGHFDGRPVLPLTVAAAGLTALVDHVVDGMTGGYAQRWAPRAMSVRADRMAGAGEWAVLGGIGEFREHGIRFRGEVRVRGEVVSTLVLDVVVSDG
ncbi:hypothetical protein OG787_34430 [Streptomyces sp. NBC_00075]|uniref:hypothetical protein n=1 Tax=Streptomyces sp. NBC_00075 TaxID=2975641 RepID=UPI003253E4B7